MTENKSRKYKKRICSYCKKKVCMPMHKCSGKTRIQKKKEKIKNESNN